jgi:UDPglucose 6-dehydrogenase
MALINTSSENNYDFKILKSVVEINKLQSIRFFKRIKAHFNSELKGKHFAIWGLSFKPNTDDIRDAPSIKIIDSLLIEGATVAAYDPEAMDNIRRVYNDKIRLTKKSYDALEKADALIILTEWNEFRKPDFAKIISMLKAPVIFDGRNLYDLEKMEELKLNYFSIGRKSITI